MLSKFIDFIYSLIKVFPIHAFIVGIFFGMGWILCIIQLLIHLRLVWFWVYPG